MPPENGLFAEFADSQKFVALARTALDHGFNSIADGSGPLIPFTFTLGDSDEADLARHVAEELSACLDLARKFVDDQRSTLRIYAIAWDGYITGDGRRHDAIFVEAGDASGREALTLCQPYQQVRRGIWRRTRCEKVGEPVLVGRVPSRLTGPAV